ncbi:MAG: hypothetical protein MR332_00805 [Fusicatenibacter sp.]|nr:hypothetical protein [Fusicatenibacter sp.]
MKLPDHFQKRVSMTTSGVIFCAIAVGFFKCSQFGVDPFQCFAQGIWGHFFEHLVSYGIYYIFLSGIMLILDLFVARSYMGVATLVNMFLTGYVVDFTCLIINRLCPNPTLAVRIVFLAIAVLVMCFASSLYMTSNLGVSVYDAIPIVISNKSKIPFRFVRITCDLICVIIGTLSGLMPGVGTLITAFFMGPLIEYFNHSFSEPFLFGRNGKPTKG